MANDKVIGWDATEVEDSDVYTLLPPGRYPFALAKFSRVRAKDGLPMADLKLTVDGGELGVTTVSEKIKLLESLQWKIAQFFKSLGFPAVDGKVQISWDALEEQGLFGVCDVEVNEYEKDGEKRRNNRVSAFLPAGTPATGAFEPKTDEGLQGYVDAAVQAAGKAF